MKTFLFLISLLCYTVSFAQDAETLFRIEQHEKEEKQRIKDSIRQSNLIPGYPKAIGDSLITSTGFKVGVGQLLKIGKGNMPDGSFKYIRINSESAFRYVGGVQNQSNSANALQPNYAGMNCEIAKFSKKGNNKFGYINYLVLKVGDIARYECDLENAIAVGEIDVPEQFRPKKQENVIVIEQKQTISVADELLKLKKLLDEGVLSKEEFEAAKKKLLEKL